MRYLYTTFLAAILLVISQGTLPAAGLGLTCQTLNADTLVPQTVFHPGDRVIVSVTATFDDAIAANQKVDITIDAKAVVSGISLPFSLTTETIELNKDPRTPGASLLHSGTEQKKIDIPSPLPNCSVTLKIKASINKIGKANTTNTITVTN